MRKCNPCLDCKGSACASPATASTPSLAIRHAGTRWRGKMDFAIRKLHVTPLKFRDTQPSGLMRPIYICCKAATDWRPLHPGLSIRSEDRLLYAISRLVHLPPNERSKPASPIVGRPGRMLFCGRVHSSSPVTVCSSSALVLGKNSLPGLGIKVAATLCFPGFKLDVFHIAWPLESRGTG